MTNIPVSGGSVVVTLGFIKDLGMVSFVCRVFIIPWIISIEPQPHLNLKFLPLKALCLVAVSWD